MSCSMFWRIKTFGWKVGPYETWLHIKKQIWCRFFHTKNRCYNEVWKESSSHWHCNKCYPCGRTWDLIVLMMRKENEKTKTK